MLIYIFSTSNFLVTFFLPSFPIQSMFLYQYPLNYLIFSPILLGHHRSYKNPDFSFKIVSFDPPRSVATIGFFIDWASTATLPKASGLIDDETTTSEIESLQAYFYICQQQGNLFIQIISQKLDL